MLPRAFGLLFAACLVFASGCLQAEVRPQEDTAPSGRLELLNETYEWGIGDPTLDIPFDVPPGWHRVVINSCVEASTQTAGVGPADFSVWLTEPGKEPDLMWRETGIYTPAFGGSYGHNSEGRKDGLPPGEWLIQARGNASVTMTFIVWVTQDMGKLSSEQDARMCS